MQKKVALLFVFLLSASSSFGDLKDKIEKLNDTVKSVGKNQPDCTTCYYTSAGQGANIGTLMKSCIESICPEKDFSLSALYEKMIDRSSKPDAVFDKELGPIVNSIAKEDANDKTTRSTQLLEWLKDPETLKATGGIRLFNMYTALNSISNFQFKSDNGKVVVDQEKSRGLFSKMTDPEFNKRAQVINKMMVFFMDKAIPETDPGRVQLYYPGVKFKERVDEVLASFDAKRKKIESDPELKTLTNLNEFKEMISGEKLKTQFSSSEQINPDSIDELNKTNSVLNLFVSMSTDPELKGLLDSSPIDIKKASAELGTEKLLLDRIEKQKSILAGSNSAISAKCKVAFAMGQEGLPTQKQVDAFKTKVSAIKDKFLNGTKGIMCSEATKKYESDVNSWTASVPLSREQHLANMKASLSRALDKAKNWKQQVDEINGSPLKDVYYGVGIASLREDYNESTSSADQICKNLMPNLMPDATAYFSNTFVAGPMVVKHDDAGGICHHELGHKLFHFMKYQNTCGDKSDFSKTRSCLLINHTELTTEELLVESGKTSLGGDSKYESEDWADLISSMVDDKANNFACLFARKLKDEDYLSLSLRNADVSDPHSSDLFRLLHLNFLKSGKIPSQCEQALSARGEKANFKNCLQIK